MGTLRRRTRAKRFSLDLLLLLVSGYGNFAPKTDTGKVFVMFNAIVGVGYFAYFLNIVGSCVTAIIKQRLRRKVRPVNQSTQRGLFCAVSGSLRVPGGWWSQRRMSGLRSPVGTPTLPPPSFVLSETSTGRANRRTDSTSTRRGSNADVVDRIQHLCSWSVVWCGGRVGRRSVVRQNGGVDVEPKRLMKMIIMCTIFYIFATSFLGPALAKWGYGPSPSSAPARTRRAQ